MFGVMFPPLDPLEVLCLEPANIPFAAPATCRACLIVMSSNLWLASILVASSSAARAAMLRLGMGIRSGLANNVRPNRGVHI